VLKDISTIWICLLYPIYYLNFWTQTIQHLFQETMISFARYTLDFLSGRIGNVLYCYQDVHCNGIKGGGAWLKCQFTNIKSKCNSEKKIKSTCLIVSMKTRYHKTNNVNYLIKIMGTFMLFFVLFSAECRVRFCR
jgi:hypothetical protein